MNRLQANYQAVIEHIAADIRKRENNDGEDTTEMLNFLHDWLVCRRGALEERRSRAILGFHKKMEAYLSMCENFWKNRHGRTYEAKLDELFEVKKRVSKIYRLSGFDACCAIMLAVKPMREILPLKQYDEYAPALATLENIKDECYEQLGTCISI